MIACRPQGELWRTAALSEGEPPMQRHKVTQVFAAVVLILAACTSTAHTLAAEAALPGNNGRIAFFSDLAGNYDVYSMNPDGSGLTKLTHNPKPDGGPSWSPDGTKIAFDSLRR